MTDSGKNGGTLTPIKQVTTQYNALDKPTSECGDHVTGWRPFDLGSHHRVPNIQANANSDANGSPLSSDQSLDDWGKRELLAEGIGGVVGGVAAWAGMAAGPAVTAMFNAPNPEIVANGVGLITGGAGGIIGQGISQTVFPSHPQQQSQFKPAPAARKTTAPVPKKSPVTRKVASLEQLVIEHQVCIQTEEGH